MVSRSDLLDSALGELNRRPAATMAEIAAAIGVSRATLHRRFSSREALVAEIAERALRRWASSQAEAEREIVAAPSDPVRVDAALRQMLRAFVVDADDFGFILTEDLEVKYPELATRAEEILERELHLYAAAQAAGVLRADLPTRWIGLSVYGAMVAVREALRRGDVARRDIDMIVESTLLDGLRSR